MKKVIYYFILLLTIICFFTGCSGETNETIRSQCADSLEALQNNPSSHTTETITLSFPDGEIIQEITRWYMDGDCLYECVQAGSVQFRYLQYEDTFYENFDGTEIWTTSETHINIEPSHLSWDTSVNNIISWNKTSDEIQVVCNNLPSETMKTGIMVYTNSIITYYFDTQWNLKAYEVKSDLTVEEGTADDYSMSMTVAVTFHSTQDTQIRTSIDDVYSQVMQGQSKK